MLGKADCDRPSVKKRNRLTVVCSNCRRRKSKCDRQQPCGNCLRLGDQDTCRYIKELKAGKGRILIDARIDKKLSPNGQESSRNSSPNAVNIRDSTPEYVNIVPNGRFIEVKRSTMTMFSLLSDIAIEHRDPYLKSLITFRMLAIDMTVNRIHGSRQHASSNPSLPQSFAPLSIFDSDGDPLTSEGSFKRHQLIHKSLFDKFGRHRKNDASKFDESEKFITENLPPRSILYESILPFFESYVLSVVPIFHMELLKHEIAEFYDSWERTKKISVKNFDHVVYCLTLLITKLCQLSINFSKFSSKLQSPIQHLNTDKYIAIVNHFLFEMRSLRKCTLMQLQCLILLRVYHWCAPEDGDGEVMQHGQILLGTIISSCKEMGISWLSLLSPDDYFFKLVPECRPSPAIMSRDDYKKVLRMIWCYVLYWDRKMCLINGQECFIEKSFEYAETDQNALWHQKVVTLDSTILRINNLLNDFPSKVDRKAVDYEIDHALEIFNSLKDKRDEQLNLEYELILGLCKLTFTHAKMVHYEYQIDVSNFHESAQDLWNQIVHLAGVFHSYCDETDRRLEPFTKFYTNKIVGIVANRLCILIPGLILRMNRFSIADLAERNIMVKFLFGVSSLYFNEFGFDYYRCFKKMFTAKISYKILNRPADKEPWQIILRFLLHDLEKVRSGKKTDDVDIVRRIPLLVDLQEALRRLPDAAGHDVMKTWNDVIYPIGKLSGDFKLDLQTNKLQAFLVDRYANSFNIFASFYDHASQRLAETAEDANNELNVQTLHNHWVPTPFAMANSETQSSGSNYSPTTSTDLELANYELIQEMFEPLDFISYF